MVSAIILITTIIIQTLERTLSSREAFFADDHACSDYSQVTHRESSTEGESEAGEVLQLHTAL